MKLTTKRLLYIFVDKILNVKYILIYLFLGNPVILRSKSPRIKTKSFASIANLEKVGKVSQKSDKKISG